MNKNLFKSANLIKHIVLILFFSSVRLWAQESFDSEGKDFWFTYLPNWHNSNTEKCLDSLYVFISASAPTKGSITYYEVKNNIYTRHVHNFTIDSANKIYKFSLQYYYYALQGFNDSGIWEHQNRDNETVTQKSFHIQTEGNVIVYGMDYAEMTSEAFIILPTTAIGKEYYILSYNSDGKGNAVSTPSQFAVVASENNTNVFITPSVPTYKNGNNVQKVTLNKGDVYLVQADITMQNLHNDLSGTYISADKNIAVFAGHQRALIPINKSGYASRDCLIEQMIPVNSWGKNSIITPFHTDIPTNYNNDFFRVIASKDNTMIIVNKKHVTTLNKGEYYEAPLIPALITSNKPIMVAQYASTISERFLIIDSINGDPLMLIVPPVEQYKSQYNVINPDLQKIEPTIDGIKYQNAFPEQYLNIVVPDTSIDNVFLDGELIPIAQFVSIPGSTYSFATIKTTSGSHEIHSNADISVQIYGYGYAVSYGYLGGMKFRNVEANKIQYNIDSCKNQADLHYKEIFTSGIKGYEIVDAQNCYIIEKELNDKNLKFEIIGTDKSENAYFSIKIIDIYNEEVIIFDSISAKQALLFSNLDTNNMLNFQPAKIGTIQKKSFCIKNTDKKDVIIDYEGLIFEKKINFSLSSSNFPLVIKSKDSALIDVYYTPLSAGNIDIDTIFFNNFCNQFLAVRGEADADTFSFTSKCQLPIIAIGKTVEIDVETINTQAYPNPAATSEIQYAFKVENDENIEIIMIDNSGNIVQTIATETEMKRGIYKMNIPIKNLSSGMYFIRLLTPTQNNIVKFIKY